jgi:hypothetical protein
MPLPEHEAIGVGAPSGKLVTFGVSKNAAGVLPQEFVVPEQICFCLATARNVPQGIVIETI